MATYSTLSALFTAIADAIRDKTGDTATIVADDFPAAIAALYVLSEYEFTITVPSDYAGYATAPPAGSYTCKPGATWADVYSDIGLTISGSNLIFVSTYDLTFDDGKGNTTTTTYTYTFTLAWDGSPVLTTDSPQNGAAYSYTWTSTTS